jgi:hypothetical protein
MTSSQAVATSSLQRAASRRVGLRQASLAVLILLIAQFGLGMGVNLYVTLPAAGHPGHGSFFSNGPLLAAHAALGTFLILFAIFVLLIAVRARNATLMATSAAGLVAILLAYFFGSRFTDKLTNGYSLAMAIFFAAALASYTIGLYTAPTWSGTSNGMGSQGHRPPHRPTGPGGGVTADGGALAIAALCPVHGGEQVTRYLVDIVGRAPSLTILERHTLNGSPARSPSTMASPWLCSRSRSRTAGAGTSGRYATPDKLQPWRIATLDEPGTKQDRHLSGPWHITTMDD